MGQCCSVVSDSLRLITEDAERDLIQLWNETQETVLSELQNAVAKISKDRHLKDIITCAITELDKVRRLDPEKIRIAVSGTSGETAVGARSQKFWDQSHSRSTDPVSEMILSEAADQTGILARIKRMFIAPRRTPLEHSANISPAEGVLFPYEASREGSGEALPSSSPDPETPTNLAFAVRPASIAKNFRMRISGPQKSISMRKDLMSAVKREFASKARETQSDGTVKLTRDSLFERVLSISFDPKISRLKIGAQACMTESLNEMATLAPRVASSALEECYHVTERQVEAQNSKGTERLRAETLQRLICWGNLVAARSVIHEMNLLIDEESRPSSIHPPPTPCPRSQSLPT